MNWKAEAREKLKMYAAMKTALVNIPQEIAALESASYGMKSAVADCISVKGGEANREDWLLDNITRREELKQMLTIVERSVSMVERSLAVLNRDERHILEEMYIKTRKGYVDRLMEEYDLAEESSLYKKAGKALRHFTVAMYGGLGSWDTFRTVTSPKKYDILS